MSRSFVLALAILAALMLQPREARAQDGADYVVRLNRIEGQMRQLSGQVEQLQFENRTLKEQLRKFQEDVEFRFQEKGGGGRSPAPASAPQTPREKPVRRGDAFDPASEPAAPGVPRQLGSAGPAGPAATAPGPRAIEPDRVPAEARPSRGPVSGALEDDDDQDAPQPARRPLDLGAASRGGEPMPPRNGPVAGAPSGLDGAALASRSAAASGSGDPRSEYDAAYAYLIQRQYDRAEGGFRGFLQSHPRDRLVPDATYWLGETYMQRNRPREAAEQFLKVSTEHARSTKAPDALLKLGVALAALGARDQACATFAELERKYPGAAPSVRQGVDREQRRVRCAT